MTTPITEVDLGLGSNLGDRAGHLARALERLRQVPGITVVACSTVRETDPIGGPPQPRYLNAVARLATTLSAPALLAICQAIEREAGRVPSIERNLPRPLDLDILRFGTAEIDTKSLVVPHPRLRDREFVTTPMRELGQDPDALAPPSRPKLLRTGVEIAELCTRWHQGGCTIGLVPTMGALHEGHASLVRRARAECDRVVATIFVNPRQFGPHEDLARYPRTFPSDLQLCGAAGADAVFAPDLVEMYPAGFASSVAVGSEAETMEGTARPGHFGGVATVVAKLFALTRPTVAYFGRKDAQQVAVLRRLVLDLGFPLVLRECEIVREPDGLAMSSRNVFLTPQDRRAATVLVAALRSAKRAHDGGERSAERLLAIARERIAAQPRATLEYLELRDDASLLRLPAGAEVVRARLLVVARLGSPPVRLLDNMTLGDERDG